MRNQGKKVFFTVAAAGVLCGIVLSGCKKENATGDGYTYRTYTAVSPSNWNELTSQDNNDRQILDYLTSPFFEYDFKRDESGKILPGEYDVRYSFATGLKDVSEQYDKQAGSAYVWEITVRDDGKWNDGTQIDAGDFVYSMQQLLDPKFKNVRADSYYNGALVIKNAKNYVFQGSKGTFAANTVFDKYESNLDSKLRVEFFDDNAKVKSDFTSQMAGRGATNIQEALALFQDVPTSLTEKTLAALNGKTLQEIKQNAALKATWDELIVWWEEGEDGALQFTVCDHTWADVEFSDVGISAPNDKTIILQLEQPLQLLKEDGSLSYKAAYNLAALPLVKEDLYERCKKSPVQGATLWTSNYHTSVQTTASWGPYMLTQFQAGKRYVLEKNENWYGWASGLYDGQYQTDKIECETIAEYNTAWMAFKKGNIDEIGIDVSIAADYKNSPRAYFTPSDFVASLQLQSSKEALEKRQKTGFNKTLLAYPEFRKALSLGLDRDAYAKACTTSSLGGLGLFNSMHYYDVANGKVYRESDEAKRVLCNVYDVDVEQFESLDAAVDSISGLNLPQARALVNRAYEKALAANEIKSTDKVLLTFGSAVDNETSRRSYENLRAQWIALMVGTPLEGKFDVEFDASFGDAWADDFKGGAYDICSGGWVNAAWDPGYLLMAYLDPAWMYSAAWETDKVLLTHTMYGVNTDGQVTNQATDSYTATHNLQKWWELLNGEWQSGVLKEEFRVSLIAALEEQVLTHYYTVPIYNRYDASLISYKIDHATYEYNTFMGYGGLRYLKYNYNDGEWKDYLSKNTVGGELNYK